MPNLKKCILEANVEKPAPLTTESLNDLIKQLKKQDPYQQSVFERFHIQSGIEEAQNKRGYFAKRIMGRAIEKFNEWKLT